MSAPPVGPAERRQDLAGARPGPGVEATVAWVDHFGNVQLDLVPGDLAATGRVAGATVRITVVPGTSGPRRPRHVPGAGGAPSPARWVQRVRGAPPG